MAGIRDPAFWRRFSLAVHLDEEKGSSPLPLSSSSSSPLSHNNGPISPVSSRRPTLKHSDTWLERNRKKKAKMRCIGWSLSLGLVITIAAVVLVVLWMKGSLAPGSAPQATATATATPAATASPIQSGGLPKPTETTAGVR